MLTTASVPLAVAPPSLATLAVPSDDGPVVAEDARGCATAGAMVKKPPRPPRKAPIAAQARPPAPTTAALR